MPLSSPTGFADVPNDGEDYVRQNGIWIRKDIVYQNNTITAAAIIGQPAVTTQADQIMNSNPSLSTDDVLAIFFSQIQVKRPSFLVITARWNLNWNLTYAVNQSGFELTTQIFGASIKNVIEFPAPTLNPVGTQVITSTMTYRTATSGLVGKVNSAIKSVANNNPTGGTVGMSFQDCEVKGYYTPA